MLVYDLSAEHVCADVAPEQALDGGRIVIEHVRPLTGVVNAERPVRAMDAMTADIGARSHDLHPRPALIVAGIARRVGAEDVSHFAEREALRGNAGPREVERSVDRAGLARVVTQVEYDL